MQDDTMSAPTSIRSTEYLLEANYGDGTRPPFVPALTTKFEPPAACFTDVFTEGTGMDQDQWRTAAGYLIVYRGARPECYPSNFSPSVYTSIPPETEDPKTLRSNFPSFSPGICPESYDLQIQQNIGPSVRQTCCPA